MDPKDEALLTRGVEATFDEVSIVPALYRPFVKSSLFFDRMFSEDVYSLQEISTPALEDQRTIVVTGVGGRSPFAALVTDLVPERHLCASTDAFQVLPLRRMIDRGPHDNVTDWALAYFREHYRDPKITKRQIFHYVYGLFHHPDYRARYEVNLKQDLPRVPIAEDFNAFATAGEKLAYLHLKYEQCQEYPLERIESKDLPLDWRVWKMRLSKDKSSIVYNEFLTLSGIPPEMFEYRLGNRSALEWVIDQYQVSTDKRSGIANDPNRADDPEYVVRLVGRVVAVSLETMNVVKGLRPLRVATDESTSA